MINANKMKKQVGFMLFVLLLASINTFAQSKIDVMLKPGQKVEKTIDISGLQLSVMIHCDSTKNIDFLLANNSDRTLWFLGNKLSYKKFKKLNKTTWTNKQFQSENAEYFYYIDPKYNPEPEPVISIRSGSNHLFHWKNTGLEIDTKIWFYTSTNEPKGSMSSKKKDKMERLHTIPLNIKIDTVKDPCEGVEIYYDFLAKTILEIDTIIEDIAKKKQKRNYGESQSELYREKLDTITNEERMLSTQFFKCEQVRTSELKTQFTNSINKAYTDVTLRKSGNKPSPCSEDITKVKNHTGKVEGLYLKIRRDRGNKTALASYKKELEKIKQDVDTIQKLNVQCSGQLQGVLDKFAQTYKGALKELDK